MNPESSDDHETENTNSENTNGENTDSEFVAELIGDTVDPVVHQAAVVEPAVAAAVPAVAYDPTVLVPASKRAPKPPPSPMSNLAAKGGAIGAMVLGVMSFAGSFITSYAILNSFLGVALGLWGLGSNHRRMALIGIAICLVSAFFCVVEISQWLQMVWPKEEF